MLVRIFKMIVSSGFLTALEFRVHQIRCRWGLWLGAYSAPPAPGWFKRDLLLKGTRGEGSGKWDEKGGGHGRDPNMLNAKYLENGWRRLGSNGPPIGNGPLGFEWLRDWWRHVTQKGQGHDPNIFGSYYLDNGWRYGHGANGVPIGNDYLGTGASTPYKRWSKCSMEKVRRKIFAAFFRNLRERKVHYCNITFICKLIIFRTEIGQHKVV